MTSTPRRSASTSSSSVPGRPAIPSCGNATICSSTTPAQRSRTSSSASMLVSPTVGSTSTGVRTSVVPWVTARRSTSCARATTSSWVKPALSRAVVATAPESVPSPGSRASSIALSRCRWGSTRPGSTGQRSPTTVVAPAAATRPGPISAIRPSTTRTSTGASRRAGGRRSGGGRGRARVSSHDRSVPTTSSAGSWSRRKRRAVLPPRESSSPVRCSQAPSRSPTTGTWFTSWNSRIRSSRVSPWWVLAGSGSR